MKFIKILFIILLTIFPDSKCDKKFLRTRECFTDSKIARLVRCEIVDGTFFLSFDVLSPITECMVSAGAGCSVYPRVYQATDPRGVSKTILRDGA